jgi:hypothetical protein
MDNVRRNTRSLLVQYFIIHEKDYNQTKNEGLKIVNLLLEGNVFKMTLNTIILFPNPKLEYEVFQGL